MNETQTNISIAEDKVSPTLQPNVSDDEHRGLFILAIVNIIILGLIVPIFSKFLIPNANIKKRFDYQRNAGFANVSST